MNWSRVLLILAIGYWLALVAKAADLARITGLVSHPREIVYPVDGLLLVSVVLGIGTGGLYWLLNPTSRGPLWARIGIAWLLAFGGMIASPGGTDLPGLYYVPFGFSIVSFCVVSVYAVLWVVVVATRRYL